MIVDQSKNVFFVGIGGVAMCNLAILLKQMGKEVSGSDVPGFTMTDEILRQNDIPFITSFDPGLLLPDADLVIYTGAHQGSQNPQVAEATNRNIVTLQLSQATTELSKLFENTLAVCGTHGKTTTSSLLAHALQKLNQHPSFLIGTATFGENYGGTYDGNKFFVIEADEYGSNPPIDKTPKFLRYDPQYVICNNVEFDHPDIYGSVDEVENAFQTFFEKKSIKKLFLCADHAKLMQVIERTELQNYETFGYSSSADLRIIESHADEYHSYFSLEYQNKKLGEYQVKLFGEKNISNIAGAILLLLNLGFESEHIKSAVKDFTGAKRRFEEVACINDSFIFDDYAHHPSEITATINAAHSRFKNRRLVILFQPHTYSRTEALKNEFIEALSKADIVFLLPIYASREAKQESHISSFDLEKLARSKNYLNIKAVDDKSALITLLQKELKKGDVIFTMGAGDVYQVKDDIIRLLKDV